MPKHYGNKSVKGVPVKGVSMDKGMDHQSASSAKYQKVKKGSFGTSGKK